MGGHPVRWFWPSLWPSFFVLSYKMFARRAEVGRFINLLFFVYDHGNQSIASSPNFSRNVMSRVSVMAISMM
jgi:hypothetical protein